MYTVIDNLKGSAQNYETEGEAHAAALKAISEHMQGPDAASIENAISITRTLYVSTVVNNAYRMVRPGVQVSPGAQIPTGTMDVSEVPNA